MLENNDVIYVHTEDEEVFIFKVDCMNHIKIEDGKLFYKASDKLPFQDYGKIVKFEYIDKNDCSEILEILKEKHVDIEKLDQSERVSEYNNSIPKIYRLSEDEFFIVKRWLND